MALANRPQLRVLTLQVIGELILSLTPEESASVFPDLYLPIVTEANLRIWSPWRAWLPTPGMLSNILSLFLTDSQH